MLYVLNWHSFVETLKNLNFMYIASLIPFTAMSTLSVNVSVQDQTQYRADLFRLGNSDGAGRKTPSSSR